MTISTTGSRISYNGNGVTTAFSFPYFFFANGDLVVSLVNATTGVETAQVLNTDYTVTGAGDGAGGTVTMTVAPASGYRLVIYRDTAITQDTDYISGDRFPAETHERALDKLTVIAQEREEDLDRSLKAPSSDPTTLDMTLPTDVDRKGKFLAFDPITGEPVASDGTVGGSASVIEYTPSGTGAVATTVQSKLREIVSVKDFAIVGDGSDETTKLQNAFNAAVGKVLLLGPNETYGVTAITIPAGVTLIANGSVFRKLAASSTTGITVQGAFEADTLSLSSPGSSVDNGIRVTGGNVRIGRLVSTSDAVDSNYGIHFQSTDATALESIRIDSMKVSNFKAAVLIYYVGFSAFDNIEIQTYVTGVYLRDVYRTTFDGANITLTSPSATGTAGQNGLLVESTLSSGSSNNLRISNWSVANAPEHSYRFGGQLTIQDVWLSNCRSTLSGNAGAGATGGCGFKVLGATSVTGQRHRDFFFENCVVEDVSTTGTGVGNFVGFYISIVDNVHISNCSVLPRDNSYSCWHGYSLEDVNDVFLTNNVAKSCRQHGLRITTGTYAGLPGWLGVNDNIKVVGGYYDVDAAAGSPVFRINSDGATTPGSVDEMVMTGVVLSGGNAAVTAESGVTYTKNFFDLEYVNPGDTTGAPPLQISGNAIRVNFRGLFYGTFGPQAADGSYYLDTTNATMRMRRGGAWVIISDIDYGVWVPTLTIVTNLDSAAVVGTNCQYVRLGSVVTVSGTLTLDATATGSTSVRLSTPIASNFTAFSHAGGIATASDGTYVGTVTADAATDTLQITCNATTTAARSVTFHATYRVA